jgi:hypothetical protein
MVQAQETRVPTVESAGEPAGPYPEVDRDGREHAHGQRPAAPVPGAHGRLEAAAELALGPARRQPPAIIRPEVVDLLPVALVLGEFPVVVAPGIVGAAQHPVLLPAGQREQRVRHREDLRDGVPGDPVPGELEETPFAAGPVDRCQRGHAVECLEVDDGYGVVHGDAPRARAQALLRGCSHFGSSS